MSTVKMAFRIFAGMPTREFCAADVAVRLPTVVSNPHKVVADLRCLGVIERSTRHGREQFYRLVPGASLPADGRIDGAERARRARSKKLAATARAIRKLKKITTATAVRKSARVRKVRA